MARRFKKKDYDFYIWLNDDVVLYEDSLEELYRCSRAQDHRAVISGIIECKNSRKILYGGSDEYKRLIKPNGNMQNITFMNGNVVLVPKVVFNNIGNLDPVFHHDLGDVDFGLRAKKKEVLMFSQQQSQWPPVSPIRNVG